MTGLVVVLILVALLVAFAVKWPWMKYRGPVPAVCVGVLLFFAVAFELVLHGRTDLCQPHQP